jgi:serine/threonine protein kinase
MTPSHKVRDYIFEEKIGEGGMGAVYRARHAMLDRPVAIKVLSDQLLTSAEFEERFLREARAQARLHHPNIVQVSDFFQESGKYYLVMALVEGESLEQRLARSRPLPLDETLRISADALAALDYAHQRGVIHRDVKSSNILLDMEGRAYLADFGIMLMVGAERRTRTGSTIGTPFYMSPEQIRRPRTLDHRTDVYSFGCVLYEMLTGHTPFEKGDEEGDTDFVVKDGHVNRMPDPPRLKNASLPPAIDSIVLKALAKSPDERYSGCGEFALALARMNPARGGPEPTFEPAAYPPPAAHPTPAAYSAPVYPSVPPRLDFRPNPAFVSQMQPSDLLINPQQRQTFFWLFVSLSALARVIGLMLTRAIMEDSASHFDFSSQPFLSFFSLGALEGFVTGGLVAGAQFFLLKKHTRAAASWAIATVAGYLVSFIFAEMVTAYRAFGLVKTSSFVFIFSWVIVAVAQWLAARRFVKGGWLLIAAVFAASIFWFLAAVAIGPAGSWPAAILRSFLAGLTLGAAQAICFIRFEKAEMEAQ